MERLNKIFPFISLAIITISAKMALLILIDVKFSKEVFLLASTINDYGILAVTIWMGFSNGGKKIYKKWRNLPVEFHLFTIFIYIYPFINLSNQYTNVKGAKYEKN